MTANPAAVIANPSPTTWRAPSRAANLGTRGATTTRPTVAGSVASPACSGVNPSELGSWNHRLSTYISALIVPAPMRIATVEPTSTRLRSRARSSRGTATRFSTMTNATAASDGHDQAADRRGGGPAPVAALAQGEDERPQGQGDEDAAGVVDRARPVRVPRLLDAPAGDDHADQPDDGVDPEQPLPAGEVDQHAADERPGRGPDRRGRPPQRDRAQLLRPGVGHGQQAEPAGQDGRAGRALDEPARRSRHRPSSTAR